MTALAEDRSDMLLALFNALDANAIPYCVLAGYRDYPHEIPSDIDFMVPDECLPLLPPILEEAARASGGLLIQGIQHEIGACYFIIARPDGPRVSYLCPDPSGSYRIGGRVWLQADDVLARRRRHERGFYVPAADDAFIYYLIKKVHKGRVTERQGQHLSALFEEEPDRCAARIRQVWPDEQAKRLEGAIVDHDWEALSALLPCLIGPLRRSGFQENGSLRLLHGGRELQRKLSRFRSPTGLSIVILGPDGSGKSTVIEQTLSQLAPAFRRTASIHFRPRLRRLSTSSGSAITDPQGHPPRACLPSMAKMAYYLVAHAIGHHLLVRPSLVRSTLVFFDRYYHDVLVDPRRYRYGGPGWFMSLLSGLVPRPDLWIVLDAPAEVLQARKKEVSLEESARQREAYRELARKLDNCLVLDASQPLERIVEAINRAVLQQLARRTASRIAAGAITW